MDGQDANYKMSLWRLDLRGAFAHCQSLNRKQARRPSNVLWTLRNRVAHIELIFARDLARGHEQIVEVAG